MKRAMVWVMVLLLAGLLMAGCAPAAPAATPAPATVLPAKTAEPTRAAVTPTSAVTPQPSPAAQTRFPSPGKGITMIVSWAAGGTTDVNARLLAAGLEKQLGTPAQVLNREGAGGQVGFTELAQAKPDGYTVGLTLFPNVVTTYLDPQRKAAYQRQSFQPLANFNSEAYALAVKGDSPYRSTQELVEAAKAKPFGVKVAAVGLLSGSHIASALLARRAGVEFSFVQFDGSGQALTALMGGHVDAASLGIGTVVGNARDGSLRLLGVTDTEESRSVPGVKTLESQGYRFQVVASHGLSAPAGTPKDVVESVSGAVKRVLEAEDTGKMVELGRAPRYMDSAAYSSYWEETESVLKPLVAELGQAAAR